MMLGDFEVTAISDGAASLDAVKLLNEPAVETEAALKDVFLSNPVDSSINAFLINTGTKLILVDTGGGAFLGPTLGKFQSNFAVAGYKPEQVDEILLTHMHRDHVGGLVINGKVSFPNATVHADKWESDFWLSKENLEKAAPDIKPRFQGVVDTVGLYIASGHYMPFEAGSEILPNVRTVASHGHTVGHTTYVIESQGQQLWLVGDVINFGAVQFDHPLVSSSFDKDGEEASASRVEIFSDAAKERALIGAAHLPFPGLGHLRATGNAWQWLPVDPSSAMR
jgi:glyoxylase-like metal-dependent hydrolase (beta-lactamase superfamily II)